LNFLFNFI